MKTLNWSKISLIIWGMTLLVSVSANAATDREKILKDAGVYGTFAVFQVNDDWWRLDKAARANAASEVKAVFEKHSKDIIVDTYLLRGLVEKADFFLRVHSTDVLANQNFLVDFMGTGLGTHLVNTYTFNGLTKALNYVPRFPEELKTDLKTPPPQGMPYAIVVPIRKDADWWLADLDSRTSMMKEHTDATVAYLKTVKRKLYHSTGLDDIDFITYFETGKLDDFNNLVIDLQRVQENRHNKQFGSPTLLGTIRPLDEILQILSR